MGFFGKVRNFLFGKKAKEKSKPVYTPQQNALLDQISNQIKGPLNTGVRNLQSMLNRTPINYSDFAAPYRRAFEQNTMPSIAERFTGGLGTGSQRSSAFGQAMGQAGRELEENILSQAWNHQMQQEQQDANIKSNAFSQLSSLLNPALAQREYHYTVPREPGVIEHLTGAAAKGFGQGVGTYFSNAAPGMIKSGVNTIRGGLGRLFGGEQDSRPRIYTANQFKSPNVNNTPYKLFNPEIFHYMNP